MKAREGIHGILYYPRLHLSVGCLTMFLNGEERLLNSKTQLTDPKSPVNTPQEEPKDSHTAVCHNQTPGKRRQRV